MRGNGPFLPRTGKTKSLNTWTGEHGLKSRTQYCGLVDYSLINGTFTHQECYYKHDKKSFCKRKTAFTDLNIFPLKKLSH